MKRSQINKGLWEGRDTCGCERDVVVYLMSLDLYRICASAIPGGKLYFYIQLNLEFFLV